MSNVTLAQADLIANEAIAKGRALNFLPLTVVVLDAGGHVVVTKREDGSGILRVEIATGKPGAHSAWDWARAISPIVRSKIRPFIRLWPRPATAR